MDIYSQLEVLNPNLLGFSSFYSFQNHFGQVINRSFGGRKFKQVVGYKNLDELNRRIEPFSYRVLKKDCLDLPNKIYQRRDVEMTAEQKSYYEQIKENAKALLSSTEQVTVNNVLTQILRLHQITCGFVKTDEGVEIEINNNRMDELINILAEMQGKVIIWANYRHNIFDIKDTLVKKYGEETVVTYFGDTKDQDRQDIVKRFQDPESPVRFFVANQQTGGYGLTLTQAHTVVYFSNNYDLEKRIQSEDRAHRIGQKNNVTYIDIICENTVDDNIVGSLRNKIDLASQSLGEKLREWLIESKKKKK